MSIVKVDKSNLETSSNKFLDEVSSLDNEISSTTSAIGSIPDNSDFPSLSSKSSLIANTLKALNTDFTTLSDNINTYLASLIEIDAEGFDTSPEALAKLNNVNKTLDVSSGNSYERTYDSPTGSMRGRNQYYSYSTGPNGTTPSNFSNNNETGIKTLVYTSGMVPTISFLAGTDSKEKVSNLVSYVETIEGKEFTIPNGLGKVHTYMGWQLITAESSPQYKLRAAAGMTFDEEGFGRIGDRYVVAVTETFGKVGDFIDVYKEDGTIIKCIIGDIKNQSDPGCNEYGHNNGQNIIEFVVDTNTWYGGHENPGTDRCHPEWDSSITKIINKGNYFDLIDEANSAKKEEPVLI